ncbi:peroxiredoxin Q [Cantharellus anzutake]|uniref:peroxiredoxin Q n=1 Tax=Cantharellus anzutake TaxID=1750568 RepID=UPI0019058992|nr:peroxiredoxin Q [Cantharellus anzutake]KAF8326015.1 peroxiredoxin Q [Cantharellus anzutake]
MAPHSLIGKPAPAFTLPSTSGETITITPGQTDGKPLAIFFFPQAGTPVCTKEACAFRDSLSANDLYTGTGVQIVGISADSTEKQKAWVKQHNLTYPVLSDPDRKTRKEYNVGSALLGLIDGRYTFIVDSKGIVRGVEDSTLSASAHTKFVDSWLEKLKSE